MNRHVAHLVTGAPLPAGFPPRRISEQLPRPSSQAASESTCKVSREAHLGSRTKRRKKKKTQKHQKHLKLIISNLSYPCQSRLLTRNILLSSTCETKVALDCAGLSCSCCTNGDTWLKVRLLAVARCFSYRCCAAAGWGRLSLRINVNILYTGSNGEGERGAFSTKTFLINSVAVVRLPHGRQRAPQLLPPFPPPQDTYVHVAFPWSEGHSVAFGRSKYNMRRTGLRTPRPPPRSSCRSSSLELRSG